MNGLDGYARQSPYSDPGRHAGLFDALPTDVGELAAVARNLVVHFVAAGLTFTGDRLAEIDHRWVDRMLDTDQRRVGTPLSAPRPLDERVVGCCRDFTLLTVAALRHQGVPARSRIGFASYLAPDFHYDHAIVEYWDGGRWVFLDAMLDPTDWPFDPGDLPRRVGAEPEGPPMFATAAQVWSAYRSGADVWRYGVAPDLPLRGPDFVGDYVILELAHRQREETLLWDVWGAMPLGGQGDPDLLDEVAALLLAADCGDDAAERELADRYRRDPRLNPAGPARCVSPTGNHTLVDLRSRAVVG
jgi:hypothetical protein